MLEKPDITNEKIREEFKSDFNNAFDAHLLENIAGKLVNCDQFVQCLECSTELGGDLYEFDSQVVDEKSVVSSIDSNDQPAKSSLFGRVTKGLWWGDGKANVDSKEILGEKGSVESKEMKPSKKIQKRDLYAAIISEIESMDKMLDELEEKIATQHEELNKEFKEFKGLVKDYSNAVQSAFEHEEDRDTFKAIKDTKGEVQGALLSLRRAFQRERDKLLEKLEKVGKTLKAPNDWDSLLERCLRPYSKICFGAFILIVRLLKSRDMIASGSDIDLSLDTCIMNILALSQLLPLFAQPKDLRSKVIIIRDDRGHLSNENMLHIFTDRIASLISSLKSSMPSWLSIS
jgi:uncharacterized protein YktA (UPF0223 family)